MARTPQDVTGAELEVLQALWARGPCSRRLLAEILYPDAGPASDESCSSTVAAQSKKAGC